MAGAVIRMKGLLVISKLSNLVSISFSSVHQQEQQQQISETASPWSRSVLNRYLAETIDDPDHYLIFTWFGVHSHNPCFRHLSKFVLCSSTKTAADVIIFVYASGKNNRVEKHARRVCSVASLRNDVTHSLTMKITSFMQIVTAVLGNRMRPSVQSTMAKYATIYFLERDR